MDKSTFGWHVKLRDWMRSLRKRVLLGGWGEWKGTHNTQSGRWGHCSWPGGVPDPKLHIGTPQHPAAGQWGWWGSCHLWTAVCAHGMAGAGGWRPSGWWCWCLECHSRRSHFPCALWLCPGWLKWWAWPEFLQREKQSRGRQKQRHRWRIDQAKYSHRGTPRNREGLELHADTPQLHDWSPMLDLVLILGVILGPSSLLSPSKWDVANKTESQGHDDGSIIIGCKEVKLVLRITTRSLYHFLANFP